MDKSTYPDNCWVSMPYENIRHRIRPGDVVSFIGNSPISRLIRLRSKASHVAGVVSGPMCEKRRLIIEADQGEVNSRALSIKLAQYNGRAFWHALDPRLNRYRFYMDRFYWKQIGKKYDYGNLFMNLFGRVSKDLRRYICSELCQYALSVAPESALRRLLGDAHPDIGRLYGDHALRPGDIANLAIFTTPVEIEPPQNLEE